MSGEKISKNSKVSNAEKQQQKLKESSFKNNICGLGVDGFKWMDPSHNSENYIQIAEDIVSGKLREEFNQYIHIKKLFDTYNNSNDKNILKDSIVMAIKNNTRHSLDSKQLERLERI